MRAAWNSMCGEAGEPREPGRGLATDGPGAMTMGAPQGGAASRGARRCSRRAFPFKFASFPSFLYKLIWDLATWHFGGRPWKPGVCPSSRHVPIEFVSFLDSLSLRSPWFPTSTYCFGTCPRGILEGACETLGGPREYTNGHKLLLGHTEPVHY